MFTQLLWSNATAIGCGATRFVKNGVHWFDIACNYAAGNVEGSPVYLDSTTGGSGCTTGTDPTYNALCSNNEPLDANYKPSLINLNNTNGTNGSNNTDGTNGSGAANFSTNYCATSCGSTHVGCNATDVSLSKSSSFEFTLF